MEEGGLRREGEGEARMGRARTRGRAWAREESERDSERKSQKRTVIPLLRKCILESMPHSKWELDCASRSLLGVFPVHVIIADLSWVRAICSAPNEIVYETRFAARGSASSRIACATPASALLATVQTAAFLSRGTALPIATPSPTMRISSRSFSPSPTAITRDGFSPRESRSTRTPAPLLMRAGKISIVQSRAMTTRAGCHHRASSSRLRSSGSFSALARISSLFGS
mmetsp:Transcript_10472/g.17574  ORF Transcript_10472/g.17574 Transcript_10472/m.17574 type:complete len:228 (+) Transcript_10472:64-747(+)